MAKTTRGEIEKWRERWDGKKINEVLKILEKQIENSKKCIDEKEKLEITIESLREIKDLNAKWKKKGGRL